MFLYKGEPTVLQNGDIVKVDITTKTIAFVRNNVQIFCKFGGNKIYSVSISASNAPKIIQKITSLTPVLNTNDSDGDILIYELSGKNEEAKK